MQDLRNETSPGRQLHYGLGDTAHDLSPFVPCRGHDWFTFLITHIMRPLKKSRPLMLATGPILFVAFVMRGLNQSHVFPLGAGGSGLPYVESACSLVFPPRGPCCS